jgi:hypothetical protein
MRAMKDIVRAGITAVVLSLALVAPSGAGPFEDGLTAYRRGDYATAIQLWRSLAVQGNALAQHNLGFMYQIGRGVPQDGSWYQKAADEPTESPRPKPWVIADDNGGVLANYYERYRTAVAAGATFRIDGRCRSACTLVLLWADRVCITERAALGFHQVRDKSGQRSQSESDRLMSLYPAPVREYISAHGGLPPPSGTMWVSGPALRGLLKPCE